MVKCKLSATSLLVAMIPSIFAQQFPSQYRTETRLILVPVTVTDRRGALVTGLKPDAFVLTEEKSPQVIRSFSEQDVPCSVGIVFDLSGSMSNQLTSAKAALKTFFTYAEPGDEASLTGFADTPLVRTGFTSDFTSLITRIQFSPAGGNTALIDAVHLAIGQMNHGANPRKALLVISDGMDNHSRYSARELMMLAAESDVQIHTLSILPAPANKKGLQLMESMRGAALLEDVSDRTGGLHFTLRNPADMEEASRRIGRAMRSQYVLGFAPANTDQSGKWHRVQVKLRVPQTRVFARQGYYAR